MNTMTFNPEKQEIDNVIQSIAARLQNTEAFRTNYLGLEPTADNQKPASTEESVFGPNAAPNAVAEPIKPSSSLSKIETPEDLNNTVIPVEVAYKDSGESRKTRIIKIATRAIIAATVVGGVGSIFFNRAPNATSQESAMSPVEANDADESSTSATTEASTSSSSTTEASTTTTPNTVPSSVSPELTAEQLGKADANVAERTKGVKLTKITDFNTPLLDIEEMGVHSFNGGDKKDYQHTPQGGLDEGADIASAANGYTADQARVQQEAFTAKGAPEYLKEQIKSGEYKPNVTVGAWKIESASAVYTNIYDNIDGKLSMDPSRPVGAEDVFYSFSWTNDKGEVVTILARRDCGLQPFDTITVPTPATPNAPRTPLTVPHRGTTTVPHRVTTTIPNTSTTVDHNKKPADDQRDNKNSPNGGSGSGGKSGSTGSTVTTLKPQSPGTTATTPSTIKPPVSFGK